MTNAKNLLCAYFFTVLIYTPCSALVSIEQRGQWPQDWPQKLEPYRNQAKTFSVAAGTQENVFQISFSNRDKFEKIWPAILKLKSERSPLILQSIETVSDTKTKKLFDYNEPLVRIYCPAYDSGGAEKPNGKKLYPFPPWPESTFLPNGDLPEYVVISKDELTWIPSSDERSGNGFKYRARIDIELVVDGKIINLNRIPLPKNTPIIDKRTLP